MLEARKGVTHPLGPCTEDVDSSLPEVVFSALCAVHALTGKSRAEIIRDAVVQALLGRISMCAPPQRRTLDSALEGLAFVSGLSKEDYIQKVLAEHAFGELHVMKHGSVGTDVTPEQLPVYGHRNRA